MVNLDYHIKEKNKSSNIREIKRTSLIKGIVNIVSSLSLYLTWYQYINDKIPDNQILTNIFYWIAIGLFYLLGLIYIISASCNRIISILNDKDIRVSIENFTDMLTFALFNVSILQLFILLIENPDDTSIKPVFIVILVTFAMVLLSLFKIIFSEIQFYNKQQIYYLIVLFLVFSIFTNWIFHLAYASLMMLLISVVICPFLIHNISGQQNRYVFYLMIWYSLASILSFWVFHLVCFSIIMYFNFLILLIFFINTYFDNKYIKI
jgi:hypothetical protein